MIKSRWRTPNKPNPKGPKPPPPPPKKSVPRDMFGDCSVHLKKDDDGVYMVMLGGAFSGFTITELDVSEGPEKRYEMAHIWDFVEVEKTFRSLSEARRFLGFEYL